MLESLPHYVPTITNTRASSIVRNNTKLLDHTICCWLLILFVYSQVLEPQKVFFLYLYSALKMKTLWGLLLSKVLQGGHLALVLLTRTINWWIWQMYWNSGVIRHLFLQTFIVVQQFCLSFIDIIRLLYCIKCKKKNPKPNNNAISASHCISAFGLSKYRRPPVKKTSPT